MPAVWLPEPADTRAWVLVRRPGQRAVREPVKSLANCSPRKLLAKPLESLPSPLAEVSVWQARKKSASSKRATMPTALEFQRELASPFAQKPLPVQQEPGPP